MGVVGSILQALLTLAGESPLIGVIMLALAALAVTIVIIIIIVFLAALAGGTL